MATTSMVHLDQWVNTQATLSESEKASVNMLSEWLASDLPNISKSEEASSSISVGLPSRPTSASSTRVAGPSLPSAPLTDAPSYLSWFAKQQAHITSSSQSSHGRALQDLTRGANEADELLDHLEAARIHISELRAGARFVEEGSEGLREEAEIMVERIDHLSQLAQALSLRLSYFAILPTSTSFLSSPSLSLVTSNDFLFTLDRLDVALAFIDAHPHYRDSPLYKMRFEHCVLRAGTLIRMYTLARWKELANEISTKLREWEKARVSKGKEKEFDSDSHVMMNLADPPIYALLWERFEEEGPSLRPLVAELEKRASSSSAPASTDVEATTVKEVSVDEKTLLSDYSKTDEADGTADAMSPGVFRSPEFVSLLTECRVAYYEARRSLLIGMISNCLARIEVNAHAETAATSSNGTKSGGTPLEVFIKRSLTFLSAVCEREISLCSEFFFIDQSADSMSYKDVSTYIQSLCAPLDDRIRPKLQKESNLSSLAAICIALIGDGELESKTSPLISSTLAVGILKEAQDRLLTKAKVTLSGPTLTQFSPKEDDLDFPAKLNKSQKHRRAQSSIGGAGLLEAALEMDNMPRKGFKQVDATSPTMSTSSVRLFASPPKSIMSSWYPPLSSTLTLLSSTNDALPTSIFVDFAYTAVDACRTNISKAGDIMASQGGFAGGRIGLSGRMDVPLFLLRHFYLLREMMASVELRRASSGANQVDRRAAGAISISQASTATVVDFAKLVDALNLIWIGLRGYRGVGAPSQAINSDPNSTQPTISSQQSVLETDLTNASNQFIDVVYQGVVLPLRVFMDQRLRPSRSRRSTSNLMSPTLSSPGQEVKSPPLQPPSPQATSTLNKVRSAVKAFETCAETNLKETNGAMRLYLEDDRAIDSLSEPIVSRIMDTFTTFVKSLDNIGLNLREIPELKGADEQRKRLEDILKA